MIRRRGLLAGLGALLAAPAIIRTPGLLMPVKAVPDRVLTLSEIVTEALRHNDSRLVENLMRQNALLATLHGTYGDPRTIRIRLPASYRPAYT